MSYNSESQARSNLKRYLFATILPIILLSVSLSFSVYDQIKQYKFTQKELVGVEAIQTLYLALTDLQKIRGYTQIALWGHKEDAQKLIELKSLFLQRLRNKNWINTTEKFNLTIESHQLHDKAKKLFQVDPATNHSLDLFSEYSNLVTELLQLMQLTADHSNLILDPELDTYYLIDILDKQIPYLAESIGRVRGVGSGLISKGKVTPEEARRLQSYQSAIRSSIENIERAQTIIAKVASNLTEELRLVPKQLDQVITHLSSQCILVQEGEALDTLNPEDFFQHATHAIELLTTPYHNGIVLLTSRVKARQDKHLRQGGIIFFGTAFAILLMLYFNRAFYYYDRQLHETMAKLSVTDQLTGLYNRRHFYAVFSKELRNVLRHDGHLYLGILDVDRFKRYNDSYGHPAGDKVLQKIASSMTNVLQRAGDYCFRIGGEEFCFFFSEPEPEKAANLATQLRLAVESLDITHTGNDPFGVVTISLGMIAVPQDPACALETLLSQADRRLYQAKETGRNRCVIK